MDSGKRISSRKTFFLKRVFPALWFGFLGYFLLSVAMRAASGGSVPVVSLIMPVVMGAVGYVIMKNMVLDLVDEVWDAGSELVVKNDGEETRVPLTEIVNVSYSVLTSPQRVTLTLRRPSLGRKEISFAAPTSWVPFRKSPVIAELIDRIDAARGIRS
jgi:hypothetical protein